MISSLAGGGKVIVEDLVDTLVNTEKRKGAKLKYSESVIDTVQMCAFV